ncbi:hypothetical protein [Streptomyces albidoflavus]|uniref:hypothetical protein n=1 Tax=Streptomyces albidoflavus TaxID=1886 RepID=UPI001C466EBE|nr:hypothetical protein [Streptomyces albidoflavus]MBV7652639.1 hypothetical protein [Streptomyces albidoflavus]MBV7714108.1 hypothetical protein [Streptomyces albidoflavus]
MINKINEKPQSVKAEIGMVLILILLDTLAFFLLWFGVVGLMGWDPDAEAPVDLSRPYFTAATVTAVIGFGSTWLLYARRFKVATLLHALIFVVMVFVFATGPQLLDKVVN